MFKWCIVHKYATTLCFHLLAIPVKLLKLWSCYSAVEFRIFLFHTIWVHACEGLNQTRVVWRPEVDTVQLHHESGYPLRCFTNFLNIKTVRLECDIRKIKAGARPAILTANYSSSFTFTRTGCGALGTTYFFCQTEQCASYDNSIF